MLADWRAGRTSWEGWDVATQRSRQAYARLIGVDPDVCVGSTVSQVLGPVAAALAGKRFLLPEVEFSSNVFPWCGRRRVRTTTVAGLADAVDSRVDAVAVSLVQSANGEIADLPAISAAARAHGALVIVDATQACGWLPFDSSLADVVVGGAYKWLMSPRGTASATWPRRCRNGSPPGPPAGTPGPTRSTRTTGCRCGWPTTPAASTSPPPGQLRGYGAGSGTARRDRGTGDPGVQRRAGQPVPDRVGPPPGTARSSPSTYPGPRSGWPPPASGPRSGPAGYAPRSTPTPPRPTWTAPWPR